MEEYSCDLTGSEFTAPDTNIRSIESHLQAQIRDLAGQFTDKTVFDTSICENVKGKILDHEDESHLSKTQNNYRRIHIASELFIGICSVYRDGVDFELNKIVHDMLLVEKYRSISRNINRKKLRSLKVEKYFAGKAQRKISKLSEESRSLQQSTAGVEEQTDHITVQEAESRREQTNEQETMERELLPEDGFQTDISKNLTQIRADHTAEEANLAMHTLNIPGGDISGQHDQFETSIKQQSMKEDLNELLQILDDQIPHEAVPKINQPESLIEGADKTKDIVEDMEIERFQGSREKFTEISEVDEVWILSDVEPVEAKRRKHSHLIIDQEIVIPNYASRALQQNRNINIERVQVFEGPPTVLESISVEHLMTTPGFRLTIPQFRRNEKLNHVYRRHLMSEKRTHQPFTAPKERAKTEQRQEVNAVQLPPTIVAEEECGVRAGMHSVPEKRDLLSDVIVEETRIEDLNLSLNGTLNKESLIGVPVSRIVQSTPIPPPDAEKISDTHSLPLPRLQQLQGTKLERKKSPPWFFSTQKPTPSPKWREFDYVSRQLQEQWTLCGMEGLEKSIDAREILKSGGDDNFANFLTLLRILDKMSLQRKLVLESRNGSVIVKPFEVPYVSEGQCLLRGKEPKF